MTVQGPVKKQQPDGMSHRGGGEAVAKIVGQTIQYPRAAILHLVENVGASAKPLSRAPSQSLLLSLAVCGGGGGGRDVLERPYTAGGVVPPPPPPDPPLSPLPIFEADRHNFTWAPLAPGGFKVKFFRAAFGGDHRGTQGGGVSQPNPPYPPRPLQTPPRPPSNTSRGGGGDPEHKNLHG